MPGETESMISVLAPLDDDDDDCQEGGECCDT